MRWGTNSVSGNEVAAARVPAHHALRHGAPLSCQSETSNRIPNLCVAPAVPMKNGCLRLYARARNRFCVHADWLLTCVVWPVGSGMRMGALGTSKSLLR